MFATEAGLVGLKRVGRADSERGWADILGELPLFARFGRRRLRELVRLGRFAEYARGEVVIAAGQPGNYFYVILSGEAKVLARRGARVLKVGDYFGELALLDSAPRSASIVAARELHVIKFPRAVLREIVERDPEVALGMMTELARRVRRLERAARPVPGLS
ncbi:MAG: family transcriptional regulator, cyclic receptor protein [Gaiellaceae bacterium]|jgi:CRP-like cAMP-binding protein|nr:family transcriptional regulator, cyclic receptor protein [Gaiellaceae bacterium]